ncbi:RNA polymerase sigma factor [Microlunatus sp. GCM10028923]|uniref:RNA polymerase sigma factor n=1 Tax=Microlunatus sp. GCM10028923 TaxID=3273400 RepID=UPI00361794CD
MTQEPSPAVAAAVAAAFTDEWGRIVASLIRQTGGWDLAEDCAQEAFALALRTWDRDGIPDRPGAWLTTVARRRALDRLRRDQVGRTKLQELIMTEGDRGEAYDPDPTASPLTDDRLRLIFTCCHPALAFEAQVALALRTLAGLTTAEIARAFGVPEPTMAKRLVRVKAKIIQAGIPYRVPPDHRLPERTAAVLGVIYLLFNEGYTATAGDDLARPDLMTEAIRLADLVALLMPDDPEAGGLLALLLLQGARQHGRVGPAGELIGLADQDRSLWDQAMIGAGLDRLRRAVRRERLGPYQLQAMIVGCHVTAARAADTDWARIVGLYDQLLTLVPSPTVRLNRAIAVAMHRGPEAGLAELAGLPETGNRDWTKQYAAARADLLRRAGRTEEAALAYRRAIDHSDNTAERAFLSKRLEI